MTETKTAIGQEVDVAVVGSGFGGAAVACRLAQAGRTVAILEQGKEYPTGRGEYDATGRGISTVRHGHFWVDLGVGMNVVRGIGVGGGSLHYFGVRLRTDPDIFENPRWPRILNRRTLDPYYDLAGDMLQAAPTLPNPVLGPPVHGEAFMAAARNCRRCKGEPHYVPIAVNTAAEPVMTAAGIPQTRCVFCGQCILGCPPSQSFKGNVNARALLTLNYLAVARNTKKAEIYPRHRVQIVRPIPDGFLLELVTIGDDNGGDDEPILRSGTLRAREVVLAAGTMGSVEVLLKSKAAGTLPQLSDKLGQYFSGNGDFLIPKTVNTPNNLQPKAGPTITAGADFSTEALKIFIEDIGAIPFLEAVMGTRALTADQPDPYQLGYLGMGSDAANGVLGLNGGRVRLYWDPDRQPAALPRDHRLPTRDEPAIGGRLRQAGDLQPGDRDRTGHRPSARRRGGLGDGGDRRGRSAGPRARRPRPVHRRCLDHSDRARHQPLLHHQRARRTGRLLDDPWPRHDRGRRRHAAQQLSARVKKMLGDFR